MGDQAATIASQVKSDAGLATRFWSRVDKGADCWTWTGWRGGDGDYGYIKFQGGEYRAHRVSWMLHFGYIPDGLMVCHACDNPACVRPDHLMLGTATANAIDTSRKGRNASQVHRERTSFANRKGSETWQIRGERHHQAKLTEEQVAEMRRLKRAGLTCAELGRLFGVSQGHASKITSGRRWAHVVQPAS